MSDTVQEQTRPALTLSDAATSCGTSRSTIRRKLDGKEFPNAYREADDGPWMVPVTDLLAAGLKVNAPTKTEVIELDQTPAAPDDVARLERELVEEKARRRAAEEIAAERGRALEDLRLALRMLGPGEQGEQSNGQSQTQGHDTANGQGSAPQRRKWWQRTTP